MDIDYKNITLKKLLEIDDFGTSRLYDALTMDCLHMVPIKVLRAIRMDETGWFLVDKYGDMLLHSIAMFGHLKKIPAAILRAIPMDETGWLRQDDGNKTPLHLALEYGYLEQIPALVWRTLPMDETGWLMPDENGDSILDLALKTKGLGGIFDPSVFAMNDRNTIQKLEAFWEWLEPTLLELGRSTKEINYYESLVNKLIKACFSLNRNTGRKKFTL
jgi:hypothetical protein